MSGKIRQIRKYNQRYKNFSFSEVMNKADEEYLEAVVEMDDKGQVLSESKFLKNGALDEKSSFQYSDGGKLAEHILHHASEDTTEKRILRRNEKDLLLEEVKYYGDDSGERTAYQYDDKDRIIAIEQYDEDGIHVSTEAIQYDEKGSVTERAMQDADGTLQEKYIFEHNPATFTIIEYHYDGKGDLQSQTLMTFDAKGAEVSSVQTTASGKLIAATYSQYDEKGNLVQRDYKDFYSKTVKNTYDDESRLLVQELYDGHGLLLRKNIFEYNDAGQLTSEQSFELDTSRGGTDKHFGTRYEYDFYE